MMIIEYEGNLHDRLTKIMGLEDQGKLRVTKLIAAGAGYYKLQDQYYGGKGVFFNPNSENRFSLPDKSKWPMYLAESPHTACSEFYQNEEFIDRSDFTTNCMVEISVQKPLKVFDETRLAPHLRISVGDLMGPRSVYIFTQKLSKALADHADGLEYLSRHNGQPCVVLWSDKLDGGGILLTTSVTRLSKYEHQGKTARQILKSECNLRITG